MTHPNGDEPDSERPNSNSLTQALQRLEQARKLQKLTEDNEIRWMRKCETAEADVSRLQQEQDNLAALLKRGRDLMQEYSDERAKLLEENALLRRSLEMLTKQLDEKDERIDELTGLVGEVD